MSILIALDDSARWQWVPPGQDGVAADARVIVTCRYPTVGEYRKSGNALRAVDETTDDERRIDLFVEALRPLVLSVTVGGKVYDGVESLLDLLTPAQLIDWAVAIYVAAQLSERDRGKSERPSHGSAAACVAGAEQGAG